MAEQTHNKIMLLCLYDVLFAFTPILSCILLFFGRKSMFNQLRHHQTSVHLVTVLKKPSSFEHIWNGAVSTWNNPKQRCAEMSLNLPWSKSHCTSTGKQNLMKSHGLFQNRRYESRGNNNMFTKVYSTVNKAIKGLSRAIHWVSLVSVIFAWVSAQLQILHFNKVEGKTDNKKCSP